jgi:hypothetical protein
MLYLKNLIYIGAIFLAIIHNLIAQPHLDSIFVWNNVPLQSHLDSLKNLKFLKNSNFMQIYVNQNEIKNFEGIAIQNVRYYFYNKKLHSITIKTEENAEHAEMLLQWLTIMFGEGKQYGLAPRYSWKGKQTEIYYDKNIITHQVEWKIVDVTIQKEYEKTYKKM